MSADGDGRRPRLTRQEARARTRRLLLEAAVDVFGRKGYAGASVEEIAEVAGFSIGALYSNFSGKEELFVELLTTRSSDRMARAMAIVSDVETPIEERRSSLARHLIDLADEDGDAAALEAEFWLYAVRHPDLQARWADQLRGNRDALASQLATWAARHQHSDRIPFDQLSTTLLALFRGLLQLRRTDPTQVPDELYATAIGWIFAGVTRTYDRVETGDEG